MALASWQLPLALNGEFGGIFGFQKTGWMEYDSSWINCFTDEIEWWCAYFFAANTIYPGFFFVQNQVAATRAKSRKNELAFCEMSLFIGLFLCKF